MRRLSIRARARVRLFGGDDALFKSLVRGVSYYGEFGSGASTKWVFDHTEAMIRSVESSPDWAKDVTHVCSFSKRLSLVQIDLGKVGRFGYPLSCEKRDRFHDYVDALWQADFKPEIVLIDGRFRVACFANGLLRAAPGTIFLFDDYCNRQHYHVVEEILRPVRFCGGQAMFEVPPRLDRDKARCLRENFLMVMN